MSPFSICKIFHLLAYKALPCFVILLPSLSTIYIILGKVPTLPLLMKVELPFQVKERVNEFGTFLLQDDKREKMLAIRNKCRYDKQKMVMEILREWLAGNGAEVSWRSLISVLIDSQLPILAGQVQTLDPENSGTQLVDPDSGIFCSETIVCRV